MINKERRLIYQCFVAGKMIPYDDQKRCHPEIRKLIQEGKVKRINDEQISITDTGISELKEVLDTDIIRREAIYF